MKITFNLSDFFQALETVAVVTPKPVSASGGAGYLFISSGTTCSLYSRDDLCVSSASFPILEGSEPGRFVYPAEYLGALKYLGNDDTCTIEAVEEDGKYKVRYTSSSGSESEHSSFDPELLSTCDEDLEASSVTHEFLAKLLREALSQSRPFLGKADDSKITENFKGAQVIDATRVDKDKNIDYSKGDGYLFVGDSFRTYHFQCESFKGKSLEIHGQHLGMLLTFLGKCGPKVSIRKGAHFTFAVNESGHVLGWPRHAKLHDKFNYYPLATDKIILKVNKTRFLNSLNHARSELTKGEDKIKFHYDPELRQVWFTTFSGTSRAKSIPVSVEIKGEEGVLGFAIGVNIDHLIELVSSVKGHDIEFRGAIFPPNATRKIEVGLFRTIDTFYLDPSGKVTPEPEGAEKCTVTRFMPSKN